MRKLLIVSIVFSFSTLSIAGTLLNPKEALGKKIFFDRSLSQPEGQSCASCHDPKAGWSGPDSQINLEKGPYHGAVNERFGNRKPPSAAYASFSPVLHIDEEEGIFIGGAFWDGRASGERLGSPTAEQAQGPFVNPVEQNLPNARAVVMKVCQSSYREDFQSLYGESICQHTELAFDKIADAINAYESSRELNAFSSKFDFFVKDRRNFPLTREEHRGLMIFMKEDMGNCAACHSLSPRPGSQPSLLTDFSYDNIGTPKNPTNPWYAMPEEFNPHGSNWIDPGLGGFLASHPHYSSHAAAEYGKHKVPTLRNVDACPHPDFVKSYGHNGYFKSLKEIVHFYNTRDVLPRCESEFDPQPSINCWPTPEVEENLNRDELGNLGLSEEDEWALVAFLKTLTDGWQPPR